MLPQGGLDRITEQLRAGLDVELLLDVSSMCLDGLDADMEAHRDLAHSKPAAEKLAGEPSPLGSPAMRPIRIPAIFSLT
jgi:hypothetical protein